ncbi:S-adenosyl-L-methionine-dependent methyltransferase [Penicillium waksmanii]|uniref:S-adenosyl-L-methionine-dependent methyltransferase n=1 Tax=Penicillium waksmanii TaxID=69791 RepID=UPI002548C98C|nr:S-adenosyl-L-methionine-dependent methyltransferase [Penicillium waksmanii]KAJ5980347.1 S-adenosyl-L-methionine-dependent methyltransferase [Penicillium waksmanii]
MDAIVTQIRDLVQSSDEATRLDIQKALRQVQLDLQDPKEVLMDLANSFLLGSVIRIGLDLKLFRVIATAQKPLTVHQLADITGASAGLLERLLRYLASNNAVKEVRPNEYAASNRTHIFASEKGEAMVCHGLDFHALHMLAMPEYFKETNYQDITSNKYTPFHKAFNTDLNSFDWLVQHPEHFVPFQKVMTSLEGSEWTEGFELLDSEAKHIPSTPAQPSERIFLVDVGGGNGHQSIQLGRKYPNLLGRLVLQDLPAVVGALSPIEGVKIEAYSFFEKQPVVGAKFYYLRRIMHDWPDQDATKILQNIAVAMTSHSRILIDDAVLPDTGAVWQVTMADLAMMNSCGGVERTKRQWESLADAAGLKIEQIHSYVASTYTSVVVLTLK